MTARFCRLALIELVPYHSQAFESGQIVDQLPSVEAVRTYARGPLARAASRDEKTIIIARQEIAWGLPADTPNVIVYKGSETRGAWRFDVRSPSISMAWNMVSRKADASSTSGVISALRKTRLRPVYTFVAVTKA